MHKERRGDVSEIMKNQSVSSIAGVGKTREEQLNRLGIYTLSDLVYFIPRAYENRALITRLSDAPYATMAAMKLTVLSEVKNVRTKNNLTVSKFKAGDESGTISVVFYNAAYVKDVFHIGAVFRFWSKIVYINGEKQLTNPQYEAVVEGVPLQPIIPVYRLTKGLNAKFINKITKTAISEILPEIIDHLPDKIRISNNLPTLTYALKQAHFPDNSKELRLALSRLAFDEILDFGLGIGLMSKIRNTQNGIKFSPCDFNELNSLLPFELTDSQKSSINDIYRDTVLSPEKPMARILVGDVGSGKTICAVYAMYIAVKSGYQAALMAPTEILANQHYKSISELLCKLGIRMELLTGTTSQKEKKRIYKAISDGDAQIVIGTHALLSEKVSFNKLGLIITDEQHRFGVAQRGMLKDKSIGAHMLVMSATPIPRTLALTMYGDLDVSRITHNPAGRQRVDTFLVDESYRDRLLTFIERQLELGGQCYVVCNAIDDAGEIDGEFSLFSIRNFMKNAPKPKNVLDFTEYLKTRLPNVKIEAMHGRLKSDEKSRIMSSFENGETKILVSTTVIEVGINVPNASLMIIEDADRFGLAQLHQLRGRVGRGERKSYCVLVSNNFDNKSRERLLTIKNSHDGFEIAEKDLILRGPGDFFNNHAENIRQSGGFEFKMSKLCDDFTLYEKAFRAAKEILSSDPALSQKKHKLLKDRIEGFMPNISSTIS
jgi:ATP-dependent DNA helicase RecG